jgi:putative Mg2+ transporter-C (MgtC) family protein
MIGEPMGQGWLQLGGLGLAFVLSTLIGFEREMHQKSAGLRTYTLVGLSSALILLISRYGSTDIIENHRIVLDPSRMAAQIVSGIGFIGGVEIFARKDMVRGLPASTTVWLTAAVGMACGAGQPILAIAITTGHFIAVVILPAVERHLPKSRWAPVSIHVAYCGSRDVLTQMMTACTQHDFAVTRLLAKGQDDEPPGFQDGSSAAAGPMGASSVVKLLIEVHGTKSIPKLAARIADIPGVVSVQAGDGGAA